MYSASERPSYNVPLSVLQSDPSQVNTCAATASFVNVSCSPDPEDVAVSWLLQGIDSIDDVGQLTSLNMVCAAPKRG